MQSFVHGKERAVLQPLLLLFFFAFSFGEGKTQTLTLHLKNQPLEKAFREIEARVAQRFVYTREMIAQSRAVTLSMEGASLLQVLEAVFREQPLAFSLSERFITVRFKDAGVVASRQDVAGRVVDETGAPLAGATVSVPGKSGVVATDENGAFVLKDMDPAGRFLVTSVGFHPRTVPLSGLSFYTVTLPVAVTPLDETLIIAYGTTTRRLSTGNVTRVSARELEKQPAANPLTLLQGRVPGLQVTQSTGLPGASVSVQLRGRTALDQGLTDDQPLFVVDGVPFAPNNGFLNQLRSALGVPTPGTLTAGGLSPFQLLSPSDIESIEVLKDADATAIYGSRGANGVVLITTKKGRPGKTLFQVSLQEGWGRVTRTPAFLSTPQYRAMRKEAFQNDGVTPTAANAFDLLLWDSTRQTDMTRLLIGGTARTHEFQGSVSGGDEATRFLLSSAFRRETTVYPDPLGSTRVAVHLTLHHRPLDQPFSLQFSGSYTADVNRLPQQDLAGRINLPPNLRLRDSLGNLAWNEGGLLTAYDNPLAVFAQRYRAEAAGLLTHLQLGYRLQRNLHLRLSAGYNVVHLSEHAASPASAQNPLRNVVRSASFTSGSQQGWILEPQVDYTGAWRKLKMEALLGATLQRQQAESALQSGSGYIEDALLGSLAGASSITGSRRSSDYRYGAVFGRVGLQWEGRYLLNLSARRDGSSRFGPGRQWAGFGAVGAAWILTEEKWVKRGAVLGFAKLRASSGVTGNDKIANYQYLDTWGPTANPYQGGAGLVPTKLFNPDYGWEKTTKWEGAVDLRLLQDRLSLSAAYYRNRSSNQLVQYRLPATTGFSSIVRNLDAVVENRGWELSLSATLLSGTFWQWQGSVNLTLPRTELIAFPGLAASAYSTQYVVGEPLNVLYRYHFTGVDPASGLYIVEDRNKDGAITALDYGVEGSLDPTFYGGLSQSLAYKNWSLDLLLYFTRQKGTSLLAGGVAPPGAIFNLPAAALDRWQTPGQASTIQRYTQASGGAAYTAYTDLFLRSGGAVTDASYMRLRNLNLGYALPEKWLRKTGLSRGRAFLSGQNLLTLAPYAGGDPETQNYLRMPPLRTIVAGLSLTF